MSKKKQTTLTPTLLATRSRTDLTATECPENTPPENETEGRIIEEDGNNCATHMLSMKTMIEEMRDSINKNTEMLMSAVRKDISEINEKLDKSNSRFEEAEGRISNLEDRMQNAEELNTEVDTLRKLILEVRKEYNYDASNARKNNIIVQGIPGSTRDPRVAKSTFEKLCRDDMGQDEQWIKELDLKEVYRFPAKNREDPWLLFVSFNKSIQREDFYKATPNLKGKGITVRNDLAPCLIVERNELGKVADRLRASPNNYKTKMRDTAFKVWLEILKPGATKWETWEVEEEGN